MIDSASAPAWLWIALTVAAAAAQTLRNAMQRDLTGRLGTVGATHVRFLFGFPFALLAMLALRAIDRTGWPSPGPGFLPWLALGALSQIVATALMLGAMQQRSFVVATAYVKTEPVQVALFGAIFLGERLGTISIAAIVAATTGVLLMSLPGRLDDSRGRLRAMVLGVAAGSGFALSAVGFRGAILALETPAFLPAASLTLVCSLGLQAALLSLWLALRDRAVLLAIMRAWRPSMTAGFMGALASQFWFLAFALETAARVRTLGLVEILFAQIVSARLFSQGSGPREWLGIALVVVGVLVLTQF